MDDIVIRSMAKWPDVPDVYGWLQLDRRGQWRLRSSDTPGAGLFDPVRNPAITGFIGRNYAADDRGRWFFQNGPQKVFVQLVYLPWVYRVAQEGFLDHCGRPAPDLESAWLDEEGSVVLCAAQGAGLLDDRDLGRLADGLEKGVLRVGPATLPLGRLESREVEKKFGFVRNPAPGAG